MYCNLHFGWLSLVVVSCAQEVTWLVCYGFAVTGIHIVNNEKHLPIVQLKVTWITEFILERNYLSQTDNWMLRRIMGWNSSEAGSSTWQKLRLFLDYVLHEKDWFQHFARFPGMLDIDLYFYFLICLFQDGIGHKDASITDTHWLFHWN